MQDVQTLMTFACCVAFCALISCHMVSPTCHCSETFNRHAGCKRGATNTHEPGLSNHTRQMIAFIEHPRRSPEG
jgi:hypothetical protein